MALGVLPPSEVTESPPRLNEGGPSHPCLDGKPYMVMPDNISSIASHQSLTIPANYAENARGGQHLPYPTAPGFPQG